MHVAWEDRRDGADDVRYNRSLDGGLTYGATDKRIDTDAPGAALSAAPAIVLEGGVLHVVWGDLRGGTAGIRYSRSADSGATFLVQDVPVSDGPPGANVLTRLSLAVSGDAVVAC